MSRLSILIICMCLPGCVLGALPLGIIAGVGWEATKEKDKDEPRNLSVPVAAPDLVSVSPNTGDVAGGDAVTLIGVGFQDDATVLFDGLPATNVAWVDEFTVTCATPAHIAGVVNIIITNPDSQSDILVGAFTYTAAPIPAPDLVSVSPDSGSTIGGTSVTLTGTNFQSPVNVTFGGAAATNVVVTSTSITCTTPVHAFGAVDVVVQNPDLQFDTLTNGFTYWLPTWTETSNPSLYIDAYKAICSDTSHLYLVGYDSAQGSGNTQLHIAKRNLTDGSVVTEFGTNGVITSNPSSLADALYSITHDSTTIYVAGTDSTSGNGQWRIEKRNKTDGMLINTFGINGVASSDHSIRSDAIFSIVLDSDSLYAVGYDSINGSGLYQWRIEKRSKIDGSFVSAFGTNGTIISDPSALGDVPYASALDSSNLYTVGFDRSAGAGNDGWRIEKRNKTDGLLVLGFGSGGVVTNNPSSSADVPYAVSIDSAHMYIAGCDSTPGSSQWRIEKRDLSTGALIAGFGTNGVVVNDYSSGIDIAYAVVVDGNYLYVAGSDSTPGNEQWRIEKRDTTTGILVSSFETNGAYISDFSSGGDVACSMTISGQNLFAAGHDAVPTNVQMRVLMLRK